VVFESNLEKGYEESYRIAFEKLKGKDKKQVCLNTGAVYDDRNEIICINYLNDEYLVNCLDGSVTLKASGKSATATERALILHHLVEAEDVPLSGRLISFKEIPGAGTIYYQTYYKRSILPLVKSFSGRLEVFLKSVERLGGVKESYGHASGTVRIFPRVPVTYVLWDGDDEVAPSGTILFDESVTALLPAEDIIVAASFGAYRLVKVAQPEADGQKTKG